MVFKNHVMKKSILLLSVFVTTFTLTSCKKVWNCECKTTASGTTTTTTVSSDSKLSKKDAEAWCNQGDVSVGGVTVECNLK